MEGVRSSEFGVPTGSAWTTAETVRAWLPEDSRLEMPRQGLAETGTPPPVPVPPGLALRRLVMLVATLSLSVLAFLTPARIYAEEGFTALEIIALCLFSALIIPLSGWFCSALAGLVLQAARGDRDLFDFPARPRRPSVRTALLMPLYNEDVGASFSRLSRIDASLKALEAAGAFDIFILSDSTRPDAAEAEQCIPFGFADHGALATHCNCVDHLEAEEEMKRKEDPKQKGRHVFQINPSQVAMPMIHGKIAMAVAGAARTSVVNNGSGDESTLSPCQPETKTRIDILAVAEKILVKPADVLQVNSPE